jgi:hypothetical protein
MRRGLGDAGAGRLRSEDKDLHCIIAHRTEIGKDAGHLYEKGRMAL